MQIANTQDGKRLYIKDFIKGENEAFCPFCNEKLIARQGNIREWHFAHIPDSECEYRNDDNSMSPWHIEWQERFPIEAREVVRTNNNGEMRRADVLLEKQKLVIEFQHSPITANEVSERNNFWNEAGYKTAWIFDCSASDINPEDDFFKYKYANKALDEKEAVKNKNNLLFLETKSYGILLVTGTYYIDLSLFSSDYSFTKENIIEFFEKLDDKTMLDINKVKENKNKEILDCKIDKRKDTIEQSRLYHDEDGNCFEVASIPYFFCNDPSLKCARFDDVKNVEMLEGTYLVFREDVKFKNGKWEVKGFKLEPYERELASSLENVPKATLNSRWSIDDRFNNNLDFFMFAVPKIIQEKFDKEVIEDDCVEYAIKGSVTPIISFADDAQDFYDEEYNGKGYDEDHNSILWYFYKNPDMDRGIFVNQNTYYKVLITRYNIEQISKYHKLYGIPFNSQTNKQMASRRIKYYKEKEWKMIWSK